MVNDNRWIHTCGCKWGNNNISYKAVFFEKNLAILGENIKGNYSFKGIGSNGLIAMKDGHDILAIGETTSKYIQCKWSDLLTPEEILQYNVDEDGEILYYQIKEWIPVTNVKYQTQSGANWIRKDYVYTPLIETLMKKYKEQEMNENMQKYTILLEQQKNIVLTGAPGTGKTHLANEIAEKITDKNHITNKLSLISDYYDNNKSYLDAEEEKCIELRHKFLELFPLDSIKDITLDQYCFGYDKSENNFSEWIEFILKPLGTMGSASSKIHMVYRPHDQSRGLYVDYGTGNPDNTIVKIGQAIYEIGTTGKYSGDLKFYRNWIMKVADAYSTDFYFPVYSKNHMEKICYLFDIKPDKDVFQMNHNILEYFKEKLPNLSSWMIMAIIYKLFFEVQRKEIINYDDSSEHQNPIILKTQVRIQFAQFHPSYDYTDFVEGLRPKYHTNNEGEQELGFELKNGIFKDFCTQATKFPTNKFVFIIDEINRAELSKVFGELFFSIDPGYRGNQGELNPKLQYSNLYDGKNTLLDDPFRDGFYVPANVYIIATMNDIDRSIEPFDFAMKRRFAWHEIKPTDTCDSMWEPYTWKDDAKKRMINLNELISKEFSSAYEIGGAYFLKLNNLQNKENSIPQEELFEKLWEYHIAPVIKDYLRGDKSKKLEDFKKAYDLISNEKEESSHGQS